jgi:hypothetical protein
MQIDLGDLHLMVTELQAFHDREMLIYELQARLEILEAKDDEDG